MVNFGFSIFFLFLLPFFLVHLLRMFELGREGGGGESSNEQDSSRNTFWKSSETRGLLRNVLGCSRRGPRPGGGTKAGPGLKASLLD